MRVFTSDTRSLALQFEQNSEVFFLSRLIHDRVRRHPEEELDYSRLQRVVDIIVGSIIAYPMGDDNIDFNVATKGIRECFVIVGEDLLAVRGLLQERVADTDPLGSTWEVEQARVMHAAIDSLPTLETV